MSGAGRRGRWPRILACLACLLAAPALGACESTQEESARLERINKLHATAAAKPSLQISTPSRYVKVVSATLLSGSEANAVAVTLRNFSSEALGNVPIEVTVQGRGGQVLYTNSAPGISGSLVEVPLLMPGQELTWVNDQVQIPQGESTAGASVKALVGEVAPVGKPAGSLPRMSISGTHTIEEAALGEGTEGTLTNNSGVAQSALTVYGVARRGERVVAAGRAELSQVAAHQSSSFQIFMIGQAKGAKVEVNAPASTLE